jgi:hypothetical protein
LRSIARLAKQSAAAFRRGGLLFYNRASAV